jgi:hypothetical protein
VLGEDDLALLAALGRARDLPRPVGVHAAPDTQQPALRVDVGPGEGGELPPSRTEPYRDGVEGLVAGAAHALDQGGGQLRGEDAHLGPRLLAFLTLLAGFLGIAKEGEKEAEEEAKEAEEAAKEADDEGDDV